MPETTLQPALPEPVQETKREFAAAGKPFFENLDTLRFLSFLAVFLFHVRLYEWVDGLTDNTLVLLLTRILCSGGWGVTFFFALSGFLITWLLLTEIRKTGKVHVGAFYMRRILRIWPLYGLVVLTGMVLLPLVYRYMHQELFFDYNKALYAFFLSNYGVLALDPAFNSIRSFPLIMNITWSVSIEEQFYLVWPLCFLLPERLRRYVPHGFILVSVVSALLLASDHQQLYSSSFTRIGEIAIGALFALAAFRSAAVLDFFKRLPRLLTALAYLLAFTVIALSFRLELPPLADYALHMTGAVLFSVIILEQNFSERSFFKLGRLRLFSYLGKISYGLYMLHPIAMFGASVLLQLALYRPAPVAEGPYFMLAAFGLTIVLALASYYLFERPFLKLKDRFGFIRGKAGKANPS